MNIYLVERTDAVDYDEYISIVVAANNEDEALTLIPEGGWRDGGPAPVALKCTLLGKMLDDPRILHTSYNRG